MAEYFCLTGMSCPFTGLQGPFYAASLRPAVSWSHVTKVLWRVSCGAWLMSRNVQVHPGWHKWQDFPFVGRFCCVCVPCFLRHWQRPRRLMFYCGSVGNAVVSRVRGPHSSYFVGFGCVRRWTAGHLAIRRLMHWGTSQFSHWLHCTCICREHPLLLCVPFSLCGVQHFTIFDYKLL